MTGSTKEAAGFSYHKFADIPTFHLYDCKLEHFDTNIEEPE